MLMLHGFCSFHYLEISDELNLDGSVHHFVVHLHNVPGISIKLVFFVCLEKKFMFVNFCVFKQTPKTVSCDIHFINVSRYIKLIKQLYFFQLHTFS